MNEPYDPWAELQDRDHIIFQRHDIADLTGGALYAIAGDQALVIISPRLGQIERRRALTHELVHDERRILDASPATMQLEEAIVERLTTERLVPEHQLEAFVEARTTVGPVTTHDVATEFGVPHDIAHHALTRLQRQHTNGTTARNADP